MSVPIQVTEFAPAERVPIEVIHQQRSVLSEVPETSNFLNAGLNFVFILNEHRQIVFTSQNCRDLIQGRDPKDLAGMRPGEALGCVHASQMPGGCGTSEYCQECGAAKAILASIASQKALQEFRLTRLINLTPESLDLLVFAFPFEHGGQHFSIFSVTDISHEKRRRVLERIFFHDVINSAGGLEGLAEILKSEAPPAMKSDMELLHRGLHDLLEEITCQKDLSAAESQDLSVAPASLHSTEMLKQVCQLYLNHELAKDRWIVISPGSASVRFTSDPTLLRRVLGNLVKNALEASMPGQTVTLGCEAQEQRVCFWVHNPAAMTRPVQLQVFNRSFSTKGSGRGLGTYSVKLLAERYLQGTAEFTSTPAQGTTFYVTLPNVLRPKNGSLGNTAKGDHTRLAAISQPSK